MRCYQLTEQGKILSYKEALHPEDKHKYWIIMTPEELESNKKMFKFSPKTIRECIEKVDIPKLEVYDHYDFGLLHIMKSTEGLFNIQGVNFYLSPSNLILVTKEAMDWIRALEKEILSNEEEAYTLERILYTLLDKLTEQDSYILDKLENEIGHLEEILIKGEKRDYIKEIIELRKKLLFLKRHYEPLIDIVSGLEENDNELFDNKATRYFRILNNRVNRLNMRVLNLRDYVTQVREAYDAQVGIGLNKIMKVFTLITVIFFPLTLIAGWYGMNFSNMPEITWQYGYSYVIGLSILSIVVCIYYFKKKGWL